MNCSHLQRIQKVEAKCAAKPAQRMRAAQSKAAPAVALFENTIVPALPEASTAVTKFCVAPELFVMPMPLMVSVKLGLTVMLYAEAAGVNVMPFTSVFVEIATSLVFDKPNVATSADPLGTVAGLQFVTVFQSPEAGLRSHIALPAWAKLAMKAKIVAFNTALRTVLLIR